MVSRPPAGSPHGLFRHGCATGSSIALSASNPRRHMRGEWWSGIGKLAASVCKVEAHRSLGASTPEHEEWLIK
eukprot:890436-Pyramimonas_sp.AAC.1